MFGLAIWLFHGGIDPPYQFFSNWFTKANNYHWKERKDEHKTTENSKEYMENGKIKVSKTGIKNGWKQSRRSRIINKNDAEERCTLKMGKTKENARTS